MHSRSRDDGGRRHDHGEVAPGCLACPLVRCQLQESNLGSNYVTCSASDTRHLLPIGHGRTSRSLEATATRNKKMVDVESRGQPESTQHLRLASFGVSQPSTTLRHRLTQIMAAAAYLIRTRPPSRRVRTPDYQFSVSFKRTTFEHSSTLTSFFPSFSIEKPSSSRIVRISKPQSKPHKQNKPRTNTRYSLLSKMSSFTSTFPVSVSELSAIPTVVSEQECTIEEVGDNR